jgi:hypothetical protein|tara:strand:- start:57 stop:350 length:294 start_codon:yes stop_codon:yes gene_type:complete
MSHPNGYTKEMIKEILGTSWPQSSGESGNEMRRRKGNEMRARGEKPHYPSAESRSKLPNFDENGKYIYPEGSGFSYSQYLKDNPNSTEASSYGNKVS